jgi:NAD(P)H-hydrate epimerase
MELILNTEQSKLVDNIACEYYQYNSLQLMEIASYNIFLNTIELIKKHNIRKIILICGSGNNGGDGFSLAKHLFKLLNNTNYENVILDEIIIYHVGNIDKMSLETKSNFNIWQKIVSLNKNCNYIYINNQYDIRNIDISEYSLVFECLVGVGIKSILKGLTSEIIKHINEITIRNSKIIKLSIDNPAGINVDNGNIFYDEITKEISNYFITDYTFTMFSY